MILLERLSQSLFTYNTYLRYELRPLAYSKIKKRTHKVRFFVYERDKYTA